VASAGRATPVAHQRAAVHAIDSRISAERREGDAEDTLGQAIHREHRFAPESAAREA
jgi:hypothetical protein